MRNKADISFPRNDVTGSHCPPCHILRHSQPAQRSAIAGRGGASLVFSGLGHLHTEHCSSVGRPLRGCAPSTFVKLHACIGACFLDDFLTLSNTINFVELVDTDVLLLSCCRFDAAPKFNPLDPDVRFERQHKPSTGAVHSGV